MLGGIDVEQQVHHGGQLRIEHVGPVVLEVVLRLGGVELVLLAQRDDNLVDQRVAQAADLDPLALGLLRGGDL